MPLKRSTNTPRLPFDIRPLRIHLDSFKHVKIIRTWPANGHECTEGTRNTIRMFGMHFEVAGIHHEFSFERHPGSFQLFKGLTSQIFVDDLTYLEDISIVQ